MPKIAIQAIASPQALRTALKRVVRGKHSGPAAQIAGTDGDSIASFLAHAESRLATITKQLLRGEYRFSSLRPIFVPKKNGKKRLICIPTVADRVVQRALLDYLTPKSGWLSNGISHGFVPDLGVPDAVALAVKYRTNHPWVYKTDITSFFDRIDRELLKARVRARVRHRSLHELLDMAMACEIETSRRSTERDIKILGIRAGRGVRQGMPLSPYFANLLLDGFDRACAAAGHLAIRYADDLIFFAHTKDQALALDEFCRFELAKLQLELPTLDGESKTRIYAPEEAAEFLGVDLRRSQAGGYEIAISPEQMRHVKERIYTYGNLRELRSLGLDITKFGSSLRTAVDTYAATYSYCCNAADLRNHLEAWRSEALRRVFRELGLKTEAMSEDQRWFLSL